MKFSEFPFYLPDINVVIKDLEDFLQKFTAATSFEEQDEIFMQSIDYCYDFLTMENIANVRFSLDTLNPDFKSDRNHFNNIYYDYLQMSNKIDLSLSKSVYLKQFEEKYGIFIMKKYLQDVMLFSDEAKDDLILEEDLENEYYELKAGAIIAYEGKEYTIQQMDKFNNSSDREERKRARETVHTWYLKWKQDFNILFDRLVKVRTEISHKLGFKNFVELGYTRMGKDFSYLEASKFRGYIVKYIVPIVEKLKEKQRKRIGVENLMYYDSGYSFTSGNPNPIGDVNSVMQQTVKMFSELSPETKKFIEFMVDNELFNITSKIGKAGGGYMAYFETHKSPFIISNFNGTARDIEVLIHESGHAFQAYIFKDYKLREEMNPSKDVAEIHSMSMELLTLDYMNLFFGEDTEKFLFNQLDDSLRKILFNSIRDEFQETIYQNPGLSIEERGTTWKKIQKKYGIDSTGQGSEYLDSGFSWHMLGHIFRIPFYSLEYALAQMVAYQFLFLKKENHEEAMRKYIDFCKLGGKYTFSESLKIVGLKNPFDEETVKEMADKVGALIDSIDYSKF